MKLFIAAVGWTVVSNISLVVSIPLPSDAIKSAPGGYASVNGGTSGGGQGPRINVSNLADLKKACKGDSPAVIVITSPISGADKVVVGSNKTILGKDSNAKVTGIAFNVKGSKNVILRNLTISKVRSSYGDAIGVDDSTNVWVDHCDLSSDRSHGKDYYDGLLDIKRGSDYITVTNTYFHDHWKASLVGHSDSNGAQDKGKLHVTFSQNRWSNINSRGPMLRFGTGHVYNNVYEGCNDAIHTREGAQMLVENNVFKGCKKPLFSSSNGSAVAKGNQYVGGKDTAPTGTLKSVPYHYNAMPASQVQSSVEGSAGAKMRF